MEEELLTREEAAKILGIRPNTLNIWKMKGKPCPPHYKINGSVRFKKSDVLAFIESCKVEG